MLHLDDAVVNATICDDAPNASMAASLIAVKYQNYFEMFNTNCVSCVIKQGVPHL